MLHCKTLLFLMFPLALPAPGQAPASLPTPATSVAHPGAVTPIPLTIPLASVLAARKKHASVTVPGTGTWVDAGVTVTPADHLAITASGKLTLPDGRDATPTGLGRGWKDLLRSYPAQGADVAAVVARIGSADAAVPFTIGDSWSENAPATGELFFAANIADGMQATGSYKVTYTLSKATDTAAPSGPAATNVPLQQALPLSIIDALPRRVTDQQGDLGDVVNFMIVGTEDQVKQAFTAAGWVAVDKNDDAAVLHGLLATLSKEAYTSMPMSTLYLFGRPQDLSYARAEPLMVAFVRHHLRVWNSGQSVNGRPLWVGSATHDDGLERDQRNNGITHHIDPDIDVERDFIESTFAAAGQLFAAEYVTPSNPVSSAKTATGGGFTTDGRIVVMELH